MENLKRHLPQGWLTSHLNGIEPIVPCSQKRPTQESATSHTATMWAGASALASASDAILSTSAASSRHAAFSSPLTAWLSRSA